MKLIQYTLFALLISNTTIDAQNNSDFYMENGTCKCPDANYGDTGIVTFNGQQETFTKRTKAQLQTLIITNHQNPQIKLTCTSGITDMSSLFEDTDFNQDINHWDISNVTDISAMFDNAAFFDQPIYNWDVANVIDMSSLFKDAITFNQPINTWDVSNVTNMSSMFDFAVSFNRPLDLWDVSNVQDMRRMFRRADSFNQPLNNWDVSNVNYMIYMFSNNFSFNQPLNNWNVSNVLSMFGMFNGTLLFNQPLNNWNVSNVTTMNLMFEDAVLYNQPLNDWDVSNVTSMDRMFKNATVFNQDISNWCVEQIPQEPIEFSFNTSLQIDFKPNWGETCSLDITNFDISKIILYPNPSYDILKLQNNTNVKIVEVQIINMLGQILMKLKYNSQNIDVTNLSTGIYHVIIKTNKYGILKKKMVKM